MLINEHVPSQDGMCHRKGREERVGDFEREKQRSVRDECHESMTKRNENEGPFEAVPVNAGGTNSPE